MKICVLSGRYPATEFLSPENHAIYCSHHNYTYIHCAWPTAAKNPYLNKFHFIREYLKLFDYIFWIDDDAFFLNVAKSLDRFIPAGEKFISICKSPSNKAVKTVFSSGQFMLDCKKGKAFVEAVCNGDLDLVRKWWKPEYGLFTHGDQDIMVYLYKTAPAFANGFEVFDHNAFNSRVEDLKEGSDVFLLHFTGTRTMKLKLYKDTQARLKTDGSLIREEFYNGLTVLDTGKLSYKFSAVYKKLKYSVARLLSIKK